MGVINMHVTVWDKTKQDYYEFKGVTFIINIGTGGDNHFILKFKDNRKKDKTFNRDNYDLDFIHKEG